MSIQSHTLSYSARTAVFVSALILFCLGGAHAQHGPGPFERMAGHWTGSGTIDLANGSREPLHCRASYDLLAQHRQLQLNIRCASDSYNFNLLGSAVLSGHSVSGSWSESTRSVSGNISGTAEGDRVAVRADTIGFSANLSLITHGNHQTVSIRAVDPNSGIKGATIHLRRRG